MRRPWRKRAGASGHPGDVRWLAPAGARAGSPEARSTPGPGELPVGGPTGPSPDAVALEVIGITKRFHEVVANDQISVNLQRGEILGLLGENGAGKSTLMNIVYGLHQADAGEIRVYGKPVRVDSPMRAVALGIGMVHQHFMLVPTMTVAENVAITASFAPGRARLREVSRRLLDLSERYGLDIDPGAVVGSLPLGARQRVEIAKALYRDARILILDEPTAALSGDEWLHLEQLLGGLRDAGNSIVLITHKLDEVFAVASRCTVLRAGRVVDTVMLTDTDKASLAQMMVGRDVVLERRRTEVPAGEQIVRMDSVSASSRHGRVRLRDITLEVRSSEVVGVAGVAGNGQDELVEAIIGARPIESGTIHFGDRDCTTFSVADFRQMGGAVIPADRHADAIALELSVLENLIAPDLQGPLFIRHGTLDRAAARAHCERLRREYDIRSAGVDVPMRSLSGGNQQKAVLARELSRDPNFVVAAEPTRGLDLGAAEFVHTKLNERKAAGAGILLISSDLDELMSLSDRIVVMVDGELSRSLDGSQATRQQIGLLMAGDRDGG